MKKMLILFCACIALSCGQSGDNKSYDRSTGTTESDSEEGSGANISPQLEEDSAGVFQVDTIGSSTSGDRQKEDGLEGDRNN